MLRQLLDRLSGPWAGFQQHGGRCRLVLDDLQSCATALCQRHRPHARLRDAGCVWSWKGDGFHQSDRGGSLLLFLANLIGITVTNLVVFLLQRYGSFRSCWRNLLVWLGLLGLLSLPLSSAWHDFSVRQQMDAEFGRFKAGQIKCVAIAKENPRLWSKVRLMYNNVSVLENQAIINSF